MKNGLETLFLMLRNAEIPVGIEEIARLSAIFARAPALDADGLRRVLGATLVKSVEELVVFERVYARWFAALDGEFEVMVRGRGRGRGRG